MEATELTGKHASVLKVLKNELAPVSEDWVAFAAWKRKSHLDEKRKLVRRALRELKRQGYVQQARFVHKEHRRGVGTVQVTDDGLGWILTTAGRAALEQ